MAKSSTNPRRVARVSFVSFWLCAAIFVLNDFVFIAVKDTHWVYVADYTMRLVILLLVLIGWGGRKLAGISLGRFLFLEEGTAPRPGAGWIRFSWVVLISAWGIALYKVLEPWLYRSLPNTKLFGYPNLSGIRLAIDLFPGIALVALSEEAFFRGIAFRVFGVRVNTMFRQNALGLLEADGKQRSPTRVFFSLRIWLLVILFGVSHWSSGIGAVLSAMLTGAAFSAAVVFTGTLWPALIAHYVIDFVVFSGII